MRDVLADLHRWWVAGEPVGMGTVVGTWRSAPRPAGAAMLVGPDGSAVGSVSGGCVEGAVYELAKEVIDTGTPVLQRYGVSDDDAFAVGLTCGGIIDVFVERVDQESFPELGAVAKAIGDRVPVAVATCIAAEHDGADPAGRLGRRLVVWPDHVDGTLGSDRLDAAVVDDVRGLLTTGRSGALHYGYDGQRRGEELTFFVNTYAPPPRMIVFGAIDFAAAVARIGGFLGYRVTVCDARPVFATKRRFPMAHEVVVDWPHRLLNRVAAELGPRDAVCVLTHDAKFDVPAIVAALATDVGYLGAMGSRRTHADRVERLREQGVDDAGLARIRAPIGLDLGARTPEETAIAICAEIIALRTGRVSGAAPLRDTSGPIHA